MFLVTLNIVHPKSSVPAPQKCTEAQMNLSLQEQDSPTNTLGQYVITLHHCPAFVASTDFSYGVYLNFLAHYGWVPH